MRWERLLFMHWPLPMAVLEPLLPNGAKVDTFNGEAWVGIVPFFMTDVHPAFLPSVPGLSAFTELNVRTYVTVRGVPGVWFFSLEAANPVAVRLARAGFYLPYFDARMRGVVSGQTVSFRSTRTHHGAALATFGASYRPLPGTLEGSADLIHFLTERYCLFSARPGGRLYRVDVRHSVWLLGRAEVSFDVPPGEMTHSLGLTLPERPPLLHYAERVDVRAGLPYRA